MSSADEQQQGRSPLIERNTASHEYARNPGRSSQDGRQTLRDRYNLPSRPRTGRSAAAEAQSLPSSSRRIRLNPLRDQGEEAQAKTSGSDERRGDPELNQDTNLPAGASAARPTSCELGSCPLSSLLAHRPSVPHTHFEWPDIRLSLWSTDLPNCPG
eukprot:224548-Hanusia_phi.AAC.3